MDELIIKPMFERAVIICRNIYTVSVFVRVNNFEREYFTDILQPPIFVRQNTYLRLIRQNGVELASEGNPTILRSYEMYFQQEHTNW